MKFDLINMEILPIKKIKRIVENHILFIDLLLLGHIKNEIKLQFVILKKINYQVN